MSDLIFFFKQKTAYERRISDWSSDVCSSDLEKDIFADSHPVRWNDQFHRHLPPLICPFLGISPRAMRPDPPRAIHAIGGLRHVAHQIGRASCRESVCQYV